MALHVVYKNLGKSLETEIQTTTYGSFKIPLKPYYPSTGDMKKHQMGFISDPSQTSLSEYREYERKQIINQ